MMPKHGIEAEFGKKTRKALYTIGKYMPAEALEELAAVLAMGAEKYPDERWRTLDARQNFGSIMGHLDMAFTGRVEGITHFLEDQESKLHPGSHAAARLLFQVARDKTDV